MNNVNDLRFKDLYNTQKTYKNKSVLSLNNNSINPLINRINQVESKNDNISQKDSVLNLKNNPLITKQNSKNQSLSVLNKKNTVNPLLLRLKESDTKNVDKIKKYSFEQGKDKNLMEKLLETGTNVQQNNSWFQGGAFSDGYQVGDLTRSILSTGTDITRDAAKGAGGILEGLLDLGTYGTSAVVSLFDKDKAEEIKDFGKRNFIDDTGLANRIANNSVIGMANNVVNGNWKALNPLDVETYVKETGSNETYAKNSFLGEKSGQIAEGVGYIAGTTALQAAGVPWQVTSFATSMGNEMSEAFNENATYGQAFASGIISGLAEVGSEYMFGGTGKLIGKGALDDVVAGNLGKLTRKLTKSKILQNLTEAGTKAAGEGLEEIVSGYLSAIGKQATYMNDKKLNEIYSSDEAFNEFIVGAITSGVVQAPGTVVSTVQGRDVITGYTDAEQKVIDNNKGLIDLQSRMLVKEIEDGLGRKLKSKEKEGIKNGVIQQLFDKEFQKTFSKEEIKDAINRYNNANSAVYGKTEQKSNSLITKTNVDNNLNIESETINNTAPTMNIIPNNENSIKRNIIDEKVKDYINHVRDNFETNININTDVVNDIDTLPINSGMKQATIYKRARDIFNKIGKKIFVNNNERIYVYNTDINESIAKTLKNSRQKNRLYENMAVFSKLDKIIENGREISYSNDNKNRDYYKDWKYYVANVNIDSVPYVVEFDTVLNDKDNKRHFRLERVYNLKEEVSATGANKNSVSQFGTETSPINNSIPQGNNYVNNQQKIANSENPLLTVFKEKVLKNNIKENENKYLINSVNHGENILNNNIGLDNEQTSSKYNPKEIKSAIKKDFEINGYVNLNGIQISNPNQLAEIAQIFRNPYYEITRILYFDEKNVLIGYDSFSAHKVNQSYALRDTGKNAINNLKEKMKNMGAKYIVHLHNHPSGNPKPSSQDLGCIDFLNKNGIITYGMVIDHNKYSYVEIGNRYYTDTVNSNDSEDFILDYIGKVGSVSDLAKISINTQHKQKNMLIFTDTKDNIRSIQEVTDKFIKEKENFKKYIGEQKLNTGSAKAFVSSKNSLMKPILRDYVKSDLIQDSYFEDTKSSLMQNADIAVENRKNHNLVEKGRAIFDDFSTIRKKSSSVMTSRDGVQYVVIDESFFENIPDSERPKYLMNYIKENLAGKKITTNDGTDIYILNKDDNRLGKLVYGKVTYDKRIGKEFNNKTDSDKFRFELRGNIVSNLEEMIRISKEYKKKDDIEAHSHGDFAKNGFVTRRSYLYDGKNVYKVDFNVAIDDNNRNNLYAIKGVQKKNSIQKVNEINSSHDSELSSNVNSITQNDSNVNNLHNNFKKPLPDLLKINENPKKYSVDSDNVPPINNYSDVSSNNDGKKKQPKWIETSFKNELVSKNLNKDNFNNVKYIVKGDEQTLEKVNQELFERGYEKCLESIDEAFERKEHSKLRGEYYTNFNREEAVMAQRLIQIAIQEKQFDVAEKLISQVAIAGTENGQAIQALAMINKLSPEGQYMHMQRLVKRLNEQINNRTGLQELKNKLDNTISAKSRKVINDYGTQIEKISQIDNNLAKKLAKKISDSVEPKTLKEQLEEQKIQKEIIDELFKIAIESPIKLEERAKAQKMTAVEKLELALEKKELYGKTWNDAKKILYKKYRNNSDIMIKLKNYFEKGIVPDYSIETFKKAYNEILKEKGIKTRTSIQKTLNRAAKNNLTNLNELRPDQQERVIKDIAKTLIDEVGATEQDAKILAVQVVNEFFESLKDDNINKLIKSTSKFKDLEITDEMRDMIFETKNTEELNEVMEDIRQKLADQIPSTLSDKIRSWRYFAMLFNPQTHLRNMIGNSTMSIVNIPKKVIARGFETAFDNKLNERTRTFKKATKEIQEFAKQDVNKMMDVLTGESKLGMENKIMQKRQIFKNKGLEKIVNLNSNLLENEDAMFLKKAYISNFSEYLTANNITTLSEVENNVELVEKARVFAVQEALKVTFRQDSNIANLLQQMENKFGLPGQLIIGGIVPFKKTPINITKMAMDYSPLGLGWTITKRAMDLKNGKITANEFIDHISNGLTGLGIYTLGILLFANGIITASSDDDKDDKYKQQLGWKPYSIKIGNKYYSLSWLAPSAIPLFMGAETASIVRDKNNVDFNAIVEGAGQALNPLMDMSMLQGINDALSSYNSDGIGGNIGNVVKAAGINYLLQFIPTFSSKVASTLDDTKRTTTPSRNSKFKELEGLSRRAIYKIPGLRNMLEPVKNIWGEDVKNGDNIGTRILENFILPTYGSEYAESDVDSAILKLYNETGDDAVIPKTPYSYITYNNTKYDMSASEYTRYKETYGKSLNSKLKEVFSSENYNKLSSE